MNTGGQEATREATPHRRVEKRQDRLEALNREMRHEHARELTVYIRIKFSVSSKTKKKESSREKSPNEDNTQIKLEMATKPTNKTKKTCFSRIILSINVTRLPMKHMGED